MRKEQQHKKLALGKFIVPWILLFMHFASYAQDNSPIYVSGQVKDSVGNPIIGVTVSENGTTNATNTNEKGLYTLRVSQPNATLSFSSIGFTPAEVGLNGRTVVDVSLQASSNELGQVVVVGFGTQKKISVTGAISTISMKEVQQVSTPSLSNAIAGKLPGIITRQASGEPGYDAAQVYIRGFGTSGNRTPLVLVDGVERDMNLINPQEIESFSILKDASATAVYGVRGANGVILINTKKGKKGKPNITFRSEVASQSPLRVASYINGAEYAQLMNEGLINAGKSPRWTDAEIEKFRTGSDPYLYPNVNWMDSILRDHSLQTINNLSVSGGGSFVRYFVNVGFIVQDGIYKEDTRNAYNTNPKLKRYNFRSNVDIDLSKNLTINLGVGGIIDDRTYPGNSGYAIFDAARNTSPIAFPMRNPDGTPGGVAVYLGSNPWGVATQSGYSNDRHHTLQGTFGGRWDLSSVVKGLSLNGKFAYDLFYFMKEARVKAFGVKQYLGKDANGNDIYNRLREDQPLGFWTASSGNRAIYTETSLNYDRSFNRHSVTGMLLFNRREYIDFGASTSIFNLPYRRQGLAGRATYNFDDRYIAEVNVGYNGSENFPKGQRYGLFPAVSAGWIVSNEKFWNVDFVNQLKIRGSHGQVGNDQISNSRFLFLTTINRNAPGYGFGESQIWWGGFSENQIGVSNVTWEVATKSNLGLDVGFMNNKFVLQIDAYSELREGILMQRQSVPDYAGFLSSSIPSGNIGIVKNRGIDALLEFKNTTKGGLLYSMRANFTFARNKIVENDEPFPKFDYLSRKGRAMDQPWGLIAEGIFQSEAEIARSPQQTFMTNVKPGDIKYRDINGDGVIDVFDEVAIGFPRTPEVTFGFGGTVAYKGFDLSVYFTGAARSSLFLEGRSMYPFMENIGVFNVMREYYDNRWTSNNPNGYYPATTDGNNPNNFRRSTLWQKDATYLRLRNAEVAYSLPDRILKRYGIQSFRIFLNGTNLITWDKIKVIDPEADNGTVQYPLHRLVNLGVQLSFN